MTDKILTDEDKQSARTGLFLVLSTIDDWLGLPFGFLGVAQFLRDLPEHVRTMSWEKLGSLILGAVLLYFLWPLFAIFWAIEVMFAQFFLMIWLTFLPITLFFLGAGVVWRLIELVRDWDFSLEAAQAVSRMVVRFGLLYAVYWVSLQYEDVVRAILA